MKLIKHLSLKVIFSFFVFNCCWTKIPCLSAPHSLCLLLMNLFLLGGWKSLSPSFYVSLSLSPSLTPHLLDFNQNTAATPFNRMTVSHPGKHTPPTFTTRHLPFLLPSSPPFPTSQTTSRLTTQCLLVHRCSF